MNQTEDAKEFLIHYLKLRPSDTEARYWLAETLCKFGDRAQTIGELNLVMDQVRTGSRRFRRENRQWAFRARDLLRQVRMRNTVSDIS